jgi:hypothetical protein
MRRRVIQIAGAALLLGAGFWIVSGFFESDEDRIVQLVEEMRVAAAAGDVEGVMAGVAPDAVWMDIDRDALTRRVRSALKEWPPEAVSAEVEDLVIEEDRATGTVDVFYRTRKFPRPYPVKFRVTFGRRDGRWLVTAVDQR